MDEGPAPCLPPTGHKTEDETVANAGNSARVDNTVLGGVDPGWKGVGNGDRSGLFEQSPRL
jgi:hypothetical protein